MTMGVKPVGQLGLTVHGLLVSTALLKSPFHIAAVGTNGKIAVERS